MEHQKERRRILVQDTVIFFMDITRKGIGMNEELGDSVILVHQNIRGLSSNISEFTVC